MTPKPQGANTPDSSEQDLATEVAAASAAPETPRRYLSVAEVAKQFGCKPRTVRAWITAGKIDVVRIGNKPYVPIETIGANRASVAAGDGETEYLMETSNN